jgi:hypothetical protein
MAEKSVNISDFQYTGGMDLDSTLQQVRAGDTLANLNITNVNLRGQGDSITQEINGNEYSFSLPIVNRQNKQYSFSISEVGQPQTYVVDFLNLNLSQFATATVTTTGTIATDAATFQSAISSALSAYTPVISNTISGDTATFLLSLTAELGFDWLMKDDLSATADTNPVVTQEAIDFSITSPNLGYCLPIGGIEYLGDLFMFSTCQTQAPINYTVHGVANGGGAIQISIQGNYTNILQVGYSINVQGVVGVPANGTWIISGSTYLAPYTILTLYNSTFSGSYVSGGTVTIYAEGYLAITVNQKNPDTGVWTTTELLGTKELDNRFYHPFRKEINATTQVNRTCIYWTDGFDFMRLFQYQGAYVANGAIKYYNPLGLYTYDSLELAMRNIQNTISPIVQITNVVDSGGAVPSGNWAYTVRYLDANLTPTNTGIISQPANIYNGSFANPSQIVGTPGSNSAMQVTVTVSDIPANTYPYFELIGVQYLGGSESAYIIKRVPIPADTTTIQVTHTGLETGIIPYTDGFVLPSLSIDSAGTQTICSNTLMYADLTAAEISDFSAFTQTITHVLNIDKTSLSPTGNDQYGFTLGEYQIPIETSEKVGYMFNECYRINLVYELTDGTYTPAFWCDDIIIDLNSTNRSNPFNNNRRVGNNIPNYDISDSVAFKDPQNVKSYVPYITLGNINSNYLINGIPLYKKVKRIYVFRVDNNSAGLNEILGSGIITRHVGGTYTDASGITLYGLGTAGNNYFFNNPFLINNMPFNFTPILALPTIPQSTYTSLFTGTDNWNYAVWTNNIKTAIYSSNSDIAKSCSFFCPDWIYGQASIGYQSNDEMFYFGQPDWRITYGGGDLLDIFTTDRYDNTSNIPQFEGSEIRLTGATQITTDAFTTLNNPISAATPISLYDTQVHSALAGSINYCPTFKWTDGIFNYSWTSPQHIWIFNTNDITNSSISETGDLGLYYSQYYRPLAGGSVNASTNAAAYPNNTKFGSINTGTSIPTGAYIDINGNEGTLSIDVYGGDTFTQKSYLKINVPNDNTNSGSPNPSSTGGGAVVVFVCQNRMNYNMRDSDYGGYPNPTPRVFWIQDTTSSQIAFNYDSGYTPENPDDTLPAYDPALPYITEMPNRIIYSLPQPQGSVENFYRKFPPLNFVDADTENGKITNITNVEGELFSLQITDLKRWFYNEKGTLNVNEASTSTDIVLGSGAPFSKPPESISSIGNANNIGLISGVGFAGEDIRLWIDTTTKQILFFTREGLETISLTKLIRSFAYNNLSLVTLDNPNLRNGITGVWNDKKKECIWCVCATAGTPYNGSTTYNIGDIVTYGTDPNNGIPIVYTSLVNSNTGNQPDISPSDWQEQFYEDDNGLPILGNPYYNVWTIVYGLLPVYNERGQITGSKGRFKSFYSYKPYFMVEYLDTFLTAHPNSTQDTMYEDGIGNVGWFYPGTRTQVVNGILTFVSNEFSEISKWWQGVFSTSTLIPNYIQFTTLECSSYLQDTDLDWQNENGDEFYNSIQNDTITAPNNTPQEDSTFLYGSYLIVQIKFLAYSGVGWVQQKLLKMKLKWNALSRIFNK